NTVVAGARLGSLGSGHVAVFRRTGPNSWAEDGLSLSPWTPVSHVTGNEQFGTSVALSGGLLLGGAPCDSDIAATAGSATFFNASPAAPDGDNDGIPDATDNCRFIANTDQADFDNDTAGNACDLDDDNDGLSDLDEVTFGSNPLDVDSDNDTLNDGVEFGLGTNPNSADSDNDGMSDAVEAPSGCPHPTVADSDGDGLNDGLENNAGWDPCDADT